MHDVEDLSTTITEKAAIITKWFISQKIHLYYARFAYRLYYIIMMKEEPQNNEITYKACCSIYAKMSDDFYPRTYDLFPKDTRYIIKEEFRIIGNYWQSL